MFTSFSAVKKAKFDISLSPTIYKFYYYYYYCCCACMRARIWNI